MDFEIRQIFPHERPQLEEMLCSRWYDKMVVVHDTIYYPAQLPALVAVDGGNIVGIVTYVIHGTACEIVSLDSFREGMGIGTALVDAIRQEASEKGCERLWLVTTNDNTHALGFYQKRGFHLVRIDRMAVDRSRQVKPSIPLLGEHGIPIRDEIELEIILK